MSLDHPANIVKHQTSTRDAFLGGRLQLTQPATGFRAGLDSVLLGAAVGASAGELLDLGAGVGTAALVALTFRTSLRATLVEADRETLARAKENIADNNLGDRATALGADVIAAGTVRQAAGIRTDYYSAVIANPPFFAAGQGTPAAGKARAAARHMAAPALDLWVRTAATSAAPQAGIIFIHPAESLGQLLASFEARFGAIVLLPLTPRPGLPATRVLIRGVKGSRAPLTLLASRPLHEAAGNAFAPEIDAILKGAAPLLW